MMAFDVPSPLKPKYSSIEYSLCCLLPSALDLFSTHRVVPIMHLVISYGANAQLQFAQMLQVE